MKAEDIRSLYDAEYAQSYNENYLLGELFIEATRFELSVLARLLENRRSWLDAACGTGFLLSQFNGVERVGCDIAPAMLHEARSANPPNVALCEHDIRQPKPEWNGVFNVVSCTWFAYCYGDTVAEVEQILENLAQWTALGGMCFVPFCNPDVLCKTPISYEPPPDSDDGHLLVSAVIWDWVDLPSGRRHRNLVAPHIKWMVEVFRRRFADVEVLKYPNFEKDCLASRSAIIAKDRC